MEGGRNEEAAEEEEEEKEVAPFPFSLLWSTCAPNYSLSKSSPTHSSSAARS